MSEPMSKQEALNIIDNAISRVPATRNEHTAFIKAFQTINKTMNALEAQIAATKEKETKTKKESPANDRMSKIEE